MFRTLAEAKFRPIWHFDEQNQFPPNWAQADKDTRRNLAQRQRTPSSNGRKQMKRIAMRRKQESAQGSQFPIQSIIPPG
jgi:hypothetical protein